MVLDHAIARTDKQEPSSQGDVRAACGIYRFISRAGLLLKAPAFAKRLFSE
jgi:hypothetical protein